MPVEIQEVSAELTPPPSPEAGAETASPPPDSEVLAEQVGRVLAAAERHRQRLSAD